MIFGLKFRVIHFHVPIIHLFTKYTKELLISPTLSPCTPYLRFIYICLCDRARSQRYIRAITGHIYISTLVFAKVLWVAP